jgi:hypothetical protein
MDHIWTPEPNGEHPLVAVLAVVAMVVAVLLIAWARVEVHGTADLEAALAESAPAPAKSAEEREVDEAVTAARFATGLSP